MWKSLNKVFCRHRLWVADELAVSDLDPATQVVTWKKMVCLGCGKIRTENMLKPREQVVVNWQ